MHLIVGIHRVRKVESVFRHARCSGAAKIKYSAKQQNENEWHDLLKHPHAWVLRLSALPLMLLLMSHIIVMVSPLLVSAWEKHLSTPSAKEHSEDVIRVELILSELLVIPLSEVIFRPMLIVDLALLRIVQASKRGTDLLEGIGGLWRSILIWVELQGKLLIGLFQFVLICALSNAQNLIVILFGYDCLASFNLFCI